MQLENFQSGHHEMVSLTSDILISELIRNPMVASAPTPPRPKCNHCWGCWVLAIVEKISPICCCQYEVGILTTI